MKNDTDSAQVLTLPPIIFVAGIAVALVLDRVVPISFELGTFGRISGIGFFIVGIILALWSARTLRQAGTNIDVRRSTTRVVTHGPYRFSRNPIYVAMTLGVIGVALAANSLWTLISLLFLLVILHYGVIKKEETYMERKFGQTYLEYKQRVRRWL